MVLFLVNRLMWLIVTVVAMTLIIFLLQQVVPTDPARAAVGPNAPESVVEMKRQELGLTEPIHVRYGRYVQRLVMGDLGVSVRTNRPIAQDLARFLPASSELIIAALLIGGAVGVGLGLATTMFREAGAMRLIFLSGGACPIFLLALLLSLLFWFELGWLPAGGRLSTFKTPEGPTGLLTLDGILLGRPEITMDAILHLLLPAFCLSLPIAVAVGRTLQASLTSVMRQNYIRTAYAKGLSRPRVVFRHALRNALNAPLAMLGLQFGLLFANLLIIERIFAWPGLGLYTVQAFESSDLPAVLGVALVFGATYIAVNIIVDLLQALADPRIALS